MGNEAREEEGAGTGPPAPAATSPRRRYTALLFLLMGVGVTAYLSKYGPQEQHVRIVLGRGAPFVTEVDLQYVATDGDTARAAHFSFSKGAAPRVVAHEPKIPNGPYRLQIDIDAHDVRRSVQRQVTLGGGSTQVDVSSDIIQPERPVEGNQADQAREPAP